MKRRGRGARRPKQAIQGLGALVLTLCSGAAMALGLGDIRVLSRPGQPLVAEIPVISNEPGELEQARVALASPATFARVGLEPPQGLVNELQFQLAQDAHGRAVIRVTSSSPVSQKAVAFLIEVDWGQGRLVREYSALVDAPNTAAAIAEPVIEAPAASAENRILRETQAAMAAPEPVAEAPAAAPAPAPAAESEPPAPRRAPTPVAAPVAGDSLTVRSGQTLSGIAAQLARQGGGTLDQTMVALLRANPDAFIGGNINRLKAGAVLRTPEQDELGRVGAAEARAMVREQAAQWRQARAPVPQPAEAGAAATPVASAANHSGGDAAASGQRLEIAPAVSTDAKNAGTTTGTGTGAGGEGDMAANEQLQQAREDIATRDAEIQELRTRVGELEKLKQDQQKLIAMKDSDLAAAQQRLAKAGTGTPAEGGMPMWGWGGLVLIVAGIAAWLASRRRKPSPLPPLPRHGFDAAALAAAVPGGEAPSVGEREIDREVELEEVDLREDEHPSWEAPAEPIMPVREPEPATPAWHGAAVAPLNPAPAGRDRLELAVAYLDLGDTETARSLLQEVAAGADPDARAEAVALLGQLR